jgi:hypothetical protein
LGPSYFVLQNFISSCAFHALLWQNWPFLLPNFIISKTLKNQWFWWKNQQKMDGSLTNFLTFSYVFITIALYQTNCLNIYILRTCEYLFLAQRTAQHCWSLFPLDRTNKWSLMAPNHQESPTKRVFMFTRASNVVLAMHTLFHMREHAEWWATTNFSTYTNCPKLFDRRKVLQPLKAFWASQFLQSAQHVLTQMKNFFNLYKVPKISRQRKISQNAQNFRASGFVQSVVPKIVGRNENFKPI